MEGCVGSQQGRQGRAQQHRGVQQDACAVEQETQEGPVVVEAHTAAQQAAVVVPAEDADTAGRAVPTARRHLALALVAVTAGKEPQGQSLRQLGEPLMVPGSAPEHILESQAQPLPSLSPGSLTGPNSRWPVSPLQHPSFSFRRGWWAAPWQGPQGGILTRCEIG